jgi:holo-[acyl-carrier protein] synthase
MIIGVGIDMIEVDRVVEKITKHSGFREKIFSVNEILFCESKANPGENYAARFAERHSLKLQDKG